MANNLRIFRKVRERNTTEKRIKVMHNYACDGVAHYIQTSLEVSDEFKKSILILWGFRMQLGCCNKKCKSNLGYIPAKAEMRFLSISLIDTAFNKKNDPK